RGGFPGGYHRRHAVSSRPHRGRDPERVASAARANVRQLFFDVSQGRRGSEEYRDRVMTTRGAPATRLDALGSRLLTNRQRVLIAALSVIGTIILWGSITAAGLVDRVLL